MGDIVKALAVSDVVYNDDSVCVSVVAVGDGPESLLASCIPLDRTELTRTSLTL